MSERITMKGVAECCEMFRANLVPMSPSKFWNNVAHGEFAGWVFPREDTKRRQATIYIDGFLDYMHRLERQGGNGSMNMKAKLYIDSEKSTIRIEGGTNEVMNLLVDAIAQILESYFPHNFEKQMAWVSGLLFGTIRELNKGDKDNDDED